MPKFIIIDDHTFSVSILRTCLEAVGYSRDDIWPRNNTASPSWQKALETIATLQDKGWNPDAACCVLLLDIALGGDDAATINAGLDQIRRYAGTLFNPYVMIAVSHHRSQAERLLQIVDAAMDKDALDDKAFFARIVADAIRHWEIRTGRTAAVVVPARWTLTDSASARRVEVGLGTVVLDDLVNTVAAKWDTGIAVDALTGGYSGSYLMLLRGHEGGAARAVVCKVATQPEVLQDELVRWKHAAEAYSAFGALLPPYSSTVVNETKGLRPAHYLVQSAVSGETLENCLLRDVESLPETELSNRYGPLFTRLRQMTARSLDASTIGRDAVTVFPAGSRDEIARFKTAYDTLRLVVAECRRLGLLLSDSSPADAEIEAFADLVEFAWEDRITTIWTDRVPCNEQHGDLNPRNVLLDDATGDHLIDFARFGSWPVGYDVVRLELQLFLRLFDTRSGLELFPGQLPEWLAFSSELQAAVRSGAPAETVARGTLGQRWVFRQTRAWWDAIATSPRVGDRNVAIKARFCATAHDAIRMCSYQDASWFKKVWFLVLGVRAAQYAGLIGASRAPVTVLG